jgi:hypothetical protein
MNGPPGFEDPANDGADTGAGFDATGLDGVMDMMRGAHQIMAAAHLSGFTPDQSFQFARDFFTTMMRMSIEQQGQGPK